MRQVHGGSLAALAWMLAAAGCSEKAPACSGAACGPAAGGGAAQTSFESDLLDTQLASRGGAAGSAASAPATGTKGQVASDASESGSNAAERAISEADIIQVQGDRLYALSRIAGLAVIDVSQPSALKLLGRYRELPATPFEMYLQGDVALVMFSGWGQYVPEQDGSYKWVSTSKLLALDVSNAATIQPIGSFDLPGTINDSRVVGDILYIVSRQDGYCWNCIQNKQLTSITSLRISDPRNVKKVDELAYDDGNVGWGARSVAVTQKRMYVAGPMYGASEPSESTIQVVDISDAAGDLVEGTSVRVAGQINNRWQMDEYQGVLRVVSQPWLWGSLQDTRPAVETFRVESSSKITPLGRTEIQLPMRESLRSVRFDGTRGYAITAEQKDPLFTLDLSDPAKPRQVGQVELPGFITHMEPRGERLLGLGFEQGNPEGSIAVSLFDVKDLNAPKLLSRVNFGGSWGSLPEDQDRLHKVFRVLDDAGLILVPFSGWNDSTTQEKCAIGQYTGGVQLIDFHGDVLKARGATPSVGETRRALLVQDKLISVGDERVQAFDIADRDKPAQVSQVVLSRYTTSARSLANDVVARFGADYTRSNGATVDFTSKAASADPNQSLAELDLSKLILGNTEACAPGIEILQTFVHGSQLELMYGSWTYDASGNAKEARQGLLIVDVATPSKPSVLSNTSWSNGMEYWSAYGGFYRYGYYGNATPSVRTDGTISLFESAWVSDLTNTTSVLKLRLRVIDVRDPAHVKTTTVPLTASTNVEYSGLVADGEVLMTSHFEKSSADATRGRFYLDRFDVSDPSAPARLAKVNIPGALMGFDASAKRVITSEQVRTVVSDMTYQDCYTRFASAEWNTDATRGGSGPIVVMGGGAASGTAGAAAKDQPIPEQPKGKCVGYKQRLHLVRLTDGVATLEDTFALEESQQVYSSGMGDGVLFATLSRGGYYSPRAAAVDVVCLGDCGGGGALQPTQLLVLGGFSDGQFDVGQIKVDDSSQASTWWGFWGTPSVYASGKRAMLVGQSDIAILDASDAAHPSIQKRVPLISWAQSVDMHEDVALLALGNQGVQWIELE